MALQSNPVTTNSEGNFKTVRNIGSSLYRDNYFKWQNPGDQTFSLLYLDVRCIRGFLYRDSTVITIHFSSLTISAYSSIKFVIEKLNCSFCGAITLQRIFKQSKKNV